MPPKWLVADSVNCKDEFIVHMEQPRFVARIVEINDDGTPASYENPADVTSGITYALGDGWTVFCEIHWFDHPPAEGTPVLLELFNDAELALQEHEAYLELKHVDENPTSPAES